MGLLAICAELVSGVAPKPLVALDAALDGGDVPNDRCGVIVSAQEDGRLVLFAVGQDQQIYHKFHMPRGELPTADGFTFWSSMGGTFMGGPSVARDATGRLAVYARGADRAIWLKSQVDPNGQTWTPWTSLGGQLSSAPRAILDSEGFMHVFAKAFSNNALMHKAQYHAANGTAWSEWVSLGGSLTSSPSVLIDAESMIHVFARGPDRALWHKQQLGNHKSGTVAWDKWQCLEGMLASSPAIPTTLDGVNLVETIVRAADKSFWHKGQIVSPSAISSAGTVAGGAPRAVKWGEWRQLGGIFTSSPVAVVNEDNLMQVFGRSSDQQILYLAQTNQPNGTVAWGNWSSLSSLGGGNAPPIATSPAVRMTKEGLLNVFVRGADRSIYYMQQQMVNDTAVFNGTWKSLGGNWRTFAC